MSISLYMDVHVHAAVTLALRRRGVDVLTAQEDGTGLFPDPDLLDRAAQLGRVMFTQDRDFLAEAVRRRRAGIAFAGVVFARQRFVGIGRCIDDLELIAKASELAELEDRVQYLPLEPFSQQCSARRDSRRARYCVPSRRHARACPTSGLEAAEHRKAKWHIINVLAPHER